MVFFFLLAALGLALSTAVHVGTFFGVVPAWLWLLDLGIVVVFPAGLWFSLRAFRAATRQVFFEKLSQRVPRWMLMMFGILLVYAALNFFIVVFFLNSGGVASKWDAGFVLHNRGTVIRRLTEAEYWRHESYEARLSSGHSMFFYCFSGMMLYAARPVLRTT